MRCPVRGTIASRVGVENLGNWCGIEKDVAIHFEWLGKAGVLSRWGRVMGSIHRNDVRHRPKSPSLGPGKGMSRPKMSGGGRCRKPSTLVVVGVSIAITLIFLISPSEVHAAEVTDPDLTQFFELKIRPLFVEKCYSCHSAQAKKLKGGLFVDSRDGLLKGGDSGPAIVPGQPDQSRLIDAVRYGNPDVQMPPKAKLIDGQIADLTEWVKRRRAWPAGEDRGQHRPGQAGLRPAEAQGRALGLATDPAARSACGEGRRLAPRADRLFCSVQARGGRTVACTGCRPATP